MEQKIVQQLFSRLDELKSQLTRMSLQIWEHPEVGYTEYFASKLLADYLEEHGFSVQRGVGKLDTAFIAKKGSGRFNIGFCSEYDAMPNGHSCGHNLFSVAAVGAAVAYADTQPDATVTVVGCPSEEGGVTGSSGKVFLLRDGAFNGLDIAMIAHADGSSVIERCLVSTERINITFIGKGAHAGGSPEKGINALAAGVLFMDAMNARRQHFTHGMRFNAIFTESGMSANTIPERCTLLLDMRASNPQETAKLSQWVNDTAKGASLMTGCSLEVTPSPTPTECLHPNHALACAYKECMDLLGCRYTEKDSRGYGWDMGSVGFFIPVVAPYHKIGPDTLVGHTEEFKECARSPLAFEALLTSAKCMGYTAIAYCTDDMLREAVQAEFATYALKGND